MISKIKALGLAFAAIAAMSAFAASAAQAGEIDIGSTPQGSAVITGSTEGAQTFTYTLTKTNGSKFNAICQSGTFEGTAPAQANLKEITVTATYGTAATTPTGCQLFGQASHVELHGCKYTLTGAGLAANTFNVDITGCTAEKPYITIRSALCELRIPPQHNIVDVVGKTINPHGSSDGVTLEAKMIAITLQQVGAGCPDGNLHHSKNASFVANTIATAFQDLGSAKAQKYGHQYDKYIDGAQVSLTST